MVKRFMKKFSVVLAAAFVITGLSVPPTVVNAEKQAKEMNQVGAAPKVTMKNTQQHKQHNTGWTFTIPSKLPDGACIWFDLHKDGENESYSGSVHEKTFSSSEVSAETTKKWFQTDDDNYKIDGSETSIFLKKSQEPGTYKLDAYYYDVDAYKAAVYAKYEELKKQNGAIKIRTAWWQEDFNPACEFHNFVGEPYYGTPVFTIYKADYVVPAGSFTLKMDLEEPDVSSAVTATSVQLSMYSSYGTGYEIYRKMGSSYKKIATTTKGVYKDQNLSSKTKYNYKVRVYYKDRITGKISYGPFTSYECATVGSALNLKLTVQKTKNVKLTWSKIAGAKQYKVYRRVADSYATNYSKGWSTNDGFSKWELIKTLGSGKKTYTDKKTAVNCGYEYMVVAVLSKTGSIGDSDISQTAGVSFYFGEIRVTSDYKDAVGNRTIEWLKSYGAKGYIVEKKVVDASTGSENWEQVAKLGASATKYKFEAKQMKNVKADAEGRYDLKEEYRICSYKDNGSVIGQYYYYDTTATLGMVKNVKAKKVANGIQITWSPVEGATYYEVYRLPAQHHAKNKTIGGYDVNDYDADTQGERYSVHAGGEQVVEYVDAAKPIAVDVKKWNEAIDAFRNDTTGTVTEPPFTDKLDEKKTYYYQNYKYERKEFTETSVVDYAGEIYTADHLLSNVNGQYAHPVEVKSTKNYYLGAEPGITYHYYVIAYAGVEKTWQDYKFDYNSEEDAKYQFENAKKATSVTPGTLEASTITKKAWKYYGSSYTCSSYGEASFSSVVAPSGKPAIKSITSSKKTVVIKLKKKIKGADAYRVYRATKKKGKYICVGVTTSTTFKDTGLSVGKTYYYKVVPIVANEAGEDVAGKASAVKSVKVKK